MKNTCLDLHLILLICLAATITSCSKDNAPVPQGVPVIASALVNITSSEATLTGTLQSGDGISEWGVCWSTEPHPDTSCYNVIAPVSGKAFSAQLSGLKPMSVYYARSYAVNAEGVGYGNELSFITVDKELTAEDFPDPAFRQQLLENYDLNGDGKLMVSEVLEISALTMTHKGIMSLQGIDYLQNLQKLSCCYNQLTSLKLSLPKLERLHCYVNSLESLDVSGCPRLYEIKCFGNQLTSLDVSNLTSLQVLSCYVNLLTSLDVSGCPVLVELYCLENQLTVLKLGMQNSLKYLSCEDNLLTSLDVSGCKKLVGLGCEGNPLLRTLYISADQSALLDESGNIQGWTKPEDIFYTIASSSKNDTPCVMEYQK